MINKIRLRLVKIAKKMLFLTPRDNLQFMYILKRWNIRFGKYIWHKKYNADDIITELKKFGIGKGSNIFIHSAWDTFYNYSGTEEDLIYALLNLIGNEGTLAMPAYAFKNKKYKIFDVRNTLTAAGTLAETFRTYPGVKRSINEKHSVCAIGPLTDFLLKDHPKSLICYDEYSPYYKLCEKDFKVLSLGLARNFIGTFIHCVHAVEKNRKTIPYYSVLYRENDFHYVKYIDYDGIEKKYKEIEWNKIFLRPRYIYRRLYIHYNWDKSQYGYGRISNLPISFFNAKYTYNQLTKLALEGKFFESNKGVRKKVKLENPEEFLIK